MSLVQKLKAFVAFTGTPAKFVAKAIISYAVPGGGQVIDLVDKLIDCGHETAKNSLDELAGREDQQRIEAIFDLMRSDLQQVVGQLKNFEAVPEEAKKTLTAAILAEKRTLVATKEIGKQIMQLSAVQAELKRLVAGQEDLVNLHRRFFATHVDYVEEQSQHMVTPGQLDEPLKRIEEFMSASRRGDHERAESLATALSRKYPTSAVLAAASGAAQAADRKFIEADQSVARAHRLCPGDFQLAEMTQIVTKYSRGKTPGDPPATTRNRPKEGVTLAGWKLEKLLGRGGWGQVFRARRGKVLRAIKVMHSELSQDETLVKRFKHEMSVLLLLGTHPHLAQIDPENLFDKSDDWGCWFYVMEYVEGTSLESYLKKNGAINIGQARALFTGIAEGLAIAHARGIIHRDIKPANILIRRNAEIRHGRGVLVDFGLAGPVNPHSRDAGHTVHFAAPEQLRHGRTDYRSDVYSLAATIFHGLLYNNADKRGHFAAKSLPVDVPDEVRQLLERCLHNDPDERPRDAQEFLQAWAQSKRTETTTNPQPIAVTHPRMQEVKSRSAHSTEAKLTAEWEEYKRIIARLCNGDELKRWFHDRAPSRLAEWRRLADCADTRAMVLVGICLRTGYGTGLDDIEAGKWFRIAANAGEPHGMAYLGRMCADGRGTTKDEVEAVKWYRKAAEMGENKSMVYLAVAYLDGRGVSKDYAGYVNWIQRAAHAGNVHGMLTLGSSCMLGENGVGKDEAQAVKWYCKAADAGNDSEICNDLGQRYSEGDAAHRNEVEALKWYRRAADAGNANSMYNVALAYEHGRGILKDSSEAAKWFIKAATAGDTRAMLCAAWMHTEGLSVPRDDLTAVKWFRKAAEAGDAGAMRTLALIYEQGRGVAKDEAQMLVWYRQAAEAGDSKAMVKLAAVYEQGSTVPNDTTETIKWFRKAAGAGEASAVNWFLKTAEAGNWRSFAWLGLMYAEGRGVGRNDAVAMKWFQKAADAGDAVGMRLLGAMYADGCDVGRNDDAVGMRLLGAKSMLLYADGRDVARNDAIAVKWFAAAANAGDAGGMRMLGLMYADGRGVARNDAVAVQWFNKAADAGDVAGMRWLGFMHEQDRGVLQDDGVAAECFRKAANAGDAAGMRLLGFMYKEGRGVCQDDAVAIEWFRQAAEAGDAGGMLWLGLIYKHGRGVTKDNAVATEWFCKAAQAGDASGLVWLGSMYKSGSGFGQDDTIAVKWFRKAADAGDSNGMRLLGVMYMDGRGIGQDVAGGGKWLGKAFKADTDAYPGNGGAWGDFGKPRSRAMPFACEMIDVTITNEPAVTNTQPRMPDKPLPAAHIPHSEEARLNAPKPNDAPPIRPVQSSEPWPRRHDGAAMLSGDIPKPSALALIKAEWEEYQRLERGGNGQVLVKRWFEERARFRLMEWRAISDYSYIPDYSNVGAMILAGVCYHDGYGTAVDYAVAIKLFRKAAEAGNPIGMQWLGSMYSWGRGVIKDDAVAVKWFRKAADAGDAGGMWRLGSMYENGNGVSQDDAVAVEWYRKGANAGDPDCLQWLGLMYEEGRGVNRNDAVAVEWYRKAADAGDSVCMQWLGLMYAQGRGVSRNDAVALEWFRKAADAGDYDGSFWWGSRHFGGHSINNEVIELAKRLRRAAAKPGATGHAS